MGPSKRPAVKSPEGLASPEGLEYKIFLVDCLPQIDGDRGLEPADLVNKLRKIAHGLGAQFQDALDLPDDPARSFTPSGSRPTHVLHDGDHQDTMSLQTYQAKAAGIPVLRTTWLLQ
eukprot:gene6574-6318_t